MEHKAVVEGKYYFNTHMPLNMATIVSHFNSIAEGTSCLIIGYPRAVTSTFGTLPILLLVLELRKVRTVS